METPTTTKEANIPPYTPQYFKEVVTTRAQLHALVEFVSCYQSASTWMLSDGLQFANIVVNNLYNFWIQGKTGNDDIQRYIRQTQDIINEPDWREFIDVISRSAMEFMISEYGENQDWEEAQRPPPTTG